MRPRHTTLRKRHCMGLFAPMWSHHTTLRMRPCMELLMPVLDGVSTKMWPCCMGSMKQCLRVW
eukprot:jgi/Botrbrau1/7817/Bobra.0159s0245.1